LGQQTRQNRIASFAMPGPRSRSPAVKTKARKGPKKPKSPAAKSSYTPLRRSPRLSGSAPGTPLAAGTPGSSKFHEEADGTAAATRATATDGPDRPVEPAEPVVGDDADKKAPPPAPAPRSASPTRRRSLVAALMLVALCGCLVSLAAASDALPKLPPRESLSGAPLQQARASAARLTATALGKARAHAQGVKDALAKLAVRVSGFGPAPAICLAGAAGLATLLERLNAAPHWR